MDGEELNEWYADHLYNSPLGGQWEQTGVLWSMIANSHPGRDKDSRVFMPHDIIPVIKKPEVVAPVEQPPIDQVDLARIVHRALGG